MNLTEKMTESGLKKVDAEIAKLMAETAKINTEARWYPLVISVGLVTAIITVTKIFL